MSDVDENEAPTQAFWTERQAAALLNLTEHDLYLRRRRGDGPPFTMFGSRVRYPPTTTQEWARERPRFSSNAEAHAANPKRARAAARQRAASAHARKTRWPKGDSATSGQ
jgi:hypothetical protein